MFIDLTVKSRGSYAIFATVSGSYGERVYKQVSVAYRDPERAAKRAYYLMEQGMKDVTLKNVNNGRVYYFDPPGRPTEKPIAVHNVGTPSPGFKRYLAKTLRQSYRLPEGA